MIRTFRSKALRTYFETGSAKGLSVPNTERVGRMLAVLDDATRPEDADLPGYRFHGLQGERRWSIRVSGNWRLTFGWDGADIVDVDLEDYH
ncbi:MAG: type II toxin-antitoxin system RelE/ParE family toxin [Alphaproteobacteria bacterium]|nr:type II toxin-antitoxin system RelE/ParE family toxin [Alphaproteobacteria bacterium]